MSKYTPIIGLEIHVELKTESKMFCNCSADWFGKEPNTNTCPVCLGLPGALPVPNKQAIEWTIKIGQALNCDINNHTKFDRKHYFYPDLPKGYQISQYDEPIAVNGNVTIKIKNEKSKQFEDKTFRITRVHLEEDTGKLIHSSGDSLVDFNRSGVPLVEIVTEPDFDNPDDIKVFLEELHTIIRYLDVSDANMEEGSIRLEPNISMKRREDKGFPPYKVEVKNINSFNFAKKATEYELKRQAVILDKGEIPIQETRGYDSNKGVTYSQRSKEEAQDYRYFPEPDIPPMEFTDEEIAIIKKSIPELPSEKLDRFMKVFGIKYDDAFYITRDADLADYLEKLIQVIVNNQPLSGHTLIPSNTEHDLRLRILNQKIVNVVVNKKVKLNYNLQQDSINIINEISSKLVTKDKLLPVLEKVLESNQSAVEDYKAGKQNAVMFLVGQVMKEMKGQADAQVVKSELEMKLAK